MYKFIGSLLVSLVGLLVFATSAAAQSGQTYLCGERDQTLKAFADRFDQIPIASGLAENGTVIEVLSDPNGGSWSIIMTMTNGFSCILAIGEHWEAIDPTKLKGVES